MKTRLSILLFLISNLLFGQNFDSKKELKVYNEIFIEMVGKEYYYEEAPEEPIPLEDCKTHNDSINYYIWKKKFNEWLVNPKIDTSHLIIAFNPTLIFPSKNIIESIKDKIMFPKLLVPDSIDFTNYIPLLKTLIDSSKCRPIQVNINDINNTGKFELRDLEKFRVDNPRYTKIKGFRLIGDLTLSRVCFNEEFDKGVFYMDFVCSGDCGSGLIVLINRKGENWVIEWKIPLWVS